MAKTLESLSVSDDGFTFPVTELLTGRGFVTGKSGSGKSNTASVIAEALLDRGLGLLIVDTDGEYHGLAKRYEILHAGATDDCDLQIDAARADRLADVALEENVPVVLDVSGYLEEETARAVVHDVVESLFIAEKQHRKPFLLLIEEAHEFIPQRGGGEDLSEMLIRIAKRGRKRGLGICAMSQRPAAVDKDYITQCNWLIWHRLTWETDTDVAGRILGGDAAETVQTLETGEALVMTDWDEAIERVTFRRKRTPDIGATPTLEEAYGSLESRTDHRRPGFEPEPAAETGTEASGTETPADPAPTRVDGLNGPSTDGPVRTETTVDRSGSGETTVPDTTAREGTDRTELVSVENPERKRRSSRRRNLSESRADDPLWEIGQLIVYLADVALESHQRFKRRIERHVLRSIRSIRRRRTGRDGDAGSRPTRLESKFSSLFSLAIVFLCYLAVIVAVLLLV